MFHGVIHKITLAQFFETRCMYSEFDIASNTLDSILRLTLLMIPFNFRLNTVMVTLNLPRESMAHGRVAVSPRMTVTLLCCVSNSGSMPRAVPQKYTRNSNYDFWCTKPKRFDGARKISVAKCYDNYLFIYTHEQEQDVTFYKRSSVKFESTRSLSLSSDTVK